MASPNVGIIGLWIVVFILLVTLLVLNITYGTAYQEHEAVDVTVNRSCSPALDSLISVDLQPCCVIGSQVTTSRYSPELNMVVSPVPVPYLGVCQGYCLLGVTASGDCIRRVGQSAYENCLSISAPRGCNGFVYPVAASGVTYYYPSAATQASCLEVAPCL